jgi:hypothetical protein
MLAYLSECPEMQGVLNFQAAEAGSGVIQVLTEGGEAQNNRKFIDGSVEKRFDFTVAFYKPVIHAGYIVDKGEANLNLEGILNVHALIDWLEEQNAERNFPDFGEDKQIDSVRSMNNEPTLAWIDGAHYSPPMAKYTVTVRVEYIDYSRAI